MQPLSSRKRKSDQLEMSSDDQYTVDMTSQKIPTKGGSPHPQESPYKRQRVGITLAQKQALIDNLQLELTERARKLRANYNIHAQSLRTRIEIRVNRIPLSLRRLTMGELLERYSTDQQQKPSATTGSLRGPPVPAKDGPSRPPTRGAVGSARPVKRPSHEISGGDKENEAQTPQKKSRANTAADIARNPAHVLSPTTSNSRIAPRTVATPVRSGIARPAVTPGRAAVATNILNKMVDGARSTARTAATATTSTRKTLTSTTMGNSTNTSSSTATGTGTTTSAASAAAAAAAARRKRGATVSAAANHHPPRPATRTARRASGQSESSDGGSGGGTSTVVRNKRPMTAPPGAQPKPPAPQPTAAAAGRRTVMGTIKKGVAGATTTTKKAPPAPKAAGAAAGGGGTGRVLRKRA
ncbi:Borealin N terminal-domain-containing protein [Chaetomidium leptoderma]|uniref:Borealin N terminal-domain-containing protein n=1 Tax=Chaetomidium leptoderma TaxID=669021 RepID=A0AAN6ZXB4_9PEZI|nr:Borealin N terminal-domain-containing protein [Chaetomidium leptoderma]